jgi:hypothetical protein
VGYTTVKRIKSIVSSDKTDAEIMEIMAGCDAQIDMWLNGTSASATLLSSWSSRLSVFMLQTMSNASGITGSGTSTSNISRIKIGDAEIQKEVGVNNNATSSSSSSGVRLDWRGQVQEEIKTHIRMCKRG